MLAAQPRLPFVLPQRPRMRRVSRPFHPPQQGDRYRLPRDVHDRLVSSLQSYRNRDSAFALALFLARFWSTPSRIVQAFPVDRRALVEHGELDLTEKRIRNAIRVLEEVGFLDRAVTSGSKYKATEDGLRRKPVLFNFGTDYAPMFIAANRRAAAARERQKASQRSQALVSARRASTVKFEASPLKGPKSRNPSERTVLMGPLAKECGLPPTALEPNPKLEAALDRLLQGIRQSRGSGEGGAK